MSVTEKSEFPSSTQPPLMGQKICPRHVRLKTLKSLMPLSHLPSSLVEQRLQVRRGKPRKSEATTPAQSLKILLKERGNLDGKIKLKFSPKGLILFEKKM